jgi:hypothetical protein
MGQNGWWRTLTSNLLVRYANQYPVFVRSSIYELPQENPANSTDNAKCFLQFFFCNILIRYNFIENQNCFHSMAYIFIRRISSFDWLLHSESTLVNFLPVSDIRTLTHFLLWNAGIDYLSVAAFDDLIPSHLVFLEDRVRNSLSAK